MITTIILGVAIFMSVTFIIGLINTYKIVNGGGEDITMTLNYIVLAIVCIVWSVFYYLNL